MQGRSSMEAIHIIRTLMEKYRERQKDLHLAFLDLEKAYDNVPRELIWKNLRDKGTPMKYIKFIQDIAIPGAVIFADDIVLVAEDRLNTWRMRQTTGMRTTRMMKRIEDDRRPQSAPVRRVKTIVIDGVRRRGRPKLRWEDTLKTDLKELLLSEDMTSDMNSWRTRIRVDEVDA
ncbi:hypothetical protein Tco_0271952 [Tanacetum coccineum]